MPNQKKPNPKTDAPDNDSNFGKKAKLALNIKKSDSDKRKLSSDL